MPFLAKSEYLSQHLRWFPRSGITAVKFVVCSQDVAALRRNPGWSWLGNPYSASLHTRYISSLNGGEPRHGNEPKPGKWRVLKTGHEKGVYEGIPRRPSMLWRGWEGFFCLPADCAGFRVCRPCLPTGRRKNRLPTLPGLQEKEGKL